MQFGPGGSVVAALELSSLYLRLAAVGQTRENLDAGDLVGVVFACVDAEPAGVVGCLLESVAVAVDGVTQIARGVCELGARLVLVETAKVPHAVLTHRLRVDHPHCLDH